MNCAADSFPSLLEEYGDKRPPGLLYETGTDFRKWQSNFRRVLDSLEGPLPRRVKSSVEVLETEEQSDHTRHCLRIAVSNCASLIAYLLVPLDAGPADRRPGVIAVHGHYRHGIDSIAGVRVEEDDPDNDIRHAYALHAVRAGYVAMIPALWGWPGRDGHLDLVRQRDRCNVAQMAAGMYGINLLDLHVQDCQAALDVLVERPEVDGGRIACIGNSTGGRMTMWLTVFDSRIKVCVPSGCMNTFRERSLKLSSCGIQYPFGLLRFGDVPEVFCLIPPRPMQLQAGEGDSLITPAHRDDIEAQVRNAYRLVDAKSSFDYVLHPNGHLLEWEPAAAFLAIHL